MGEIKTGMKEKRTKRDCGYKCEIWKREDFKDLRKENCVGEERKDNFIHKLRWKERNE